MALFSTGLPVWVGNSSFHYGLPGEPFRVWVFQSETPDLRFALANHLPCVARHSQCSQFRFFQMLGGASRFGLPTHQINVGPNSEHLALKALGHGLSSFTNGVHRHSPRVYAPNVHDIYQFAC